MKSKRILLCILTVLVTLSLSIFLFGCDNDRGSSDDDDDDVVCTHEWKAASCEEPAICVLCSETDGAPLGHSFGTATCEAPATCVRCAKTEGAPLGHRGGTANCTNGAFCEACGVEYTAKDASVHAKESSWVKERDSHFKLFECCNTPDTASEAHQKQNGVCSVCGFNPTISASSVSLTDGTRVSVAVSLSDNPGILGLELSVTYAEEALVLVETERGEALASFDFTSSESYASGSKFLWDALEESESDILNGELLILTFELTENAMNVDYNIILKAKAYDGELNSIFLTVTNGVISVSLE